jgi:outer membrane protein OmpU
MKNTLLATTALVTMTGAASAELSISMTARIGLQTTEGVAASSGLVYSTISAQAVIEADILENAYDGVITDDTAGNTVTDTDALTNTGTLATVAAVAADVLEMDSIIKMIEADILAAATGTDVAATAEANLLLANDLATAQAIRAAMVTQATPDVALSADDTSAVNRVRVSFSGSGTTDGGLEYGASMRADHSAAAATGAGTAGSQYISGVFGKISMGDLGGADKDATGHLAGVGLTGLGDHNEIQYQGALHNLGYQYSINGLTIGYSQNTAVSTGSNSAMGISWSGDMGGVSITAAAGQSKVLSATQTTLSASISSGGLTVKAITSTNDNGVTTAVTENDAVRTAGALEAYVAPVTEANNADLDSTGLSISYAMDAMTVTAFTMTESMTGVADADFSGIGMSYDMGGVALQVGVVDNNDQQLVDFGVSFSF